MGPFVAWKVRKPTIPSLTFAFGIEILVERKESRKKLTRRCARQVKAAIPKTEVWNFMRTWTSTMILLHKAARLLLPLLRTLKWGIFEHGGDRPPEGQHADLLRRKHRS